MGKELIPEVLESIRETGNLRKSCEKHGVKLPSFLRWVGEDPDLADQYAQAREIGLEAMAHDILDIADDGRNDTYINESGKVQVDADVVARSRLRVDSRKWLLSKLLPKKYGDKLDLTSKDEKLEGNTLHITREVIGRK
jgi:hypothetical protein